MGWIAHRKWKQIQQQPGTAGPGNMLGCCLLSFHFLWAIHPICPVHKYAKMIWRGCVNNEHQLPQPIQKISSPSPQQHQIAEIVIGVGSKHSWQLSRLVKQCHVVHRNTTLTNCILIRYCFTRGIANHLLPSRKLDVRWCLRFCFLC